MNKIYFLLCLLFSCSIFSSENLKGKNYLCSDLLWGFEFITSQKVVVINTNINNETYVNEYYYEIDSKLPYVNIFFIENNVKNIVYSIHQPTLRVDIWTMTSGGNTTREIIPEGFCEKVETRNILNFTEKLKTN